LTFLVERKVRVFYVAFQKGLKRHWWDVVMDGEMRHCWAFHAVGFPDEGLMSERYCLKFEVSESRISTEAWWATPEVVVEHFKDAVVDILAVRVEIDDRVGYIPRGLLTCVSGLKALLGVRAWWVITPNQLYRYLKRIGAESAF